MAANTEFSDLLNQTVTRYPKAGATVNSYGELAHTSTGISYSARVQDTNEVVRRDDGREQAAKTVAYIGTTAAFDPQDSFLLPDGTAPPVLRLYNAPDDDGSVHHVKIWFG